MEIKMELNKFIELYWNYYLQLEKDFFELEPYCTIDESNDRAFSTKYLHLILSICGEIDTISKRLCVCLDSNFDADTAGINDYKNILMKRFPYIANEVVSIKYHVYREIKPLQPWAHRNNPHWWGVYNKVKHHRDEIWNGKEAYKYANQKTTLETLSALYIILEYWAAFNFVIPDDREKNIREMRQLESKHLTMVNWIPFYGFFSGSEFFIIDKCRQYLNQQAQEKGDAE